MKTVLFAVIWLLIGASSIPVAGYFIPLKITKADVFAMTIAGPAMYGIIPFMYVMVGGQECVLNCGPHNDEP